MPLPSTILSASKFVLRFCLPWACAGCRATLDCFEDHGFCGHCWLRISRIQGLICKQCGLPLKEGGATCYDCRQQPLALEVRSAVQFDGPIRSAIHRFKYGGRISLAKPFSILISGAFERYPELKQAHALVPVPLHHHSQRSRGFNQAAELAHTLGPLIGRTVLDGLLIRTRKTRPQAQLSKPKRRGNVEGAFDLYPGAGERLRGLLKNRSLLLIDDVCTTGRTLEACARRLQEAGVRQIRALTLARDL